MANEDLERGTCRECRHANQGTMDAEDGFWACPWFGGTDPFSYCLIRFKDTGRFVFEPYDGTNCTWGTGAPYRSAPAGYEGREITFD